MPKPKTFKSNADGPITVTLGGGYGTLTLEPGKTYETDEQAVIDALKANSDLSEVKQKK